MITALLQHKNLGPLTDDPSEWVRHDVRGGRVIWQNTRNNDAFSQDKGKTYYLISETHLGNRKLYKTERISVEKGT